MTDPLFDARKEAEDQLSALLFRHNVGRTDDWNRTKFEEFLVENAQAIAPLLTAIAADDAAYQQRLKA